MAETVREVETAHGLARVQTRTPAGAARGLLVLGHGAGGGVDAPDLLAATRAALAAGFVVARVLQPYRVAGRRSPAPAAQLDEAWIAVLKAVRARRKQLPLVVGGRSSGARVACRTASATGANGVITLAFPVHPPGRPERSRLDELAMPEVPVLCISGAADPFGTPPEAPGRQVHLLPGQTHSLNKQPAVIAELVGDWITALAADPATR